MTKHTAAVTFTSDDVQLLVIGGFVSANADRPVEAEKFLSLAKRLQALREAKDV